MKLTAKQEKFAQLVSRGTDQSSAYREAYDTDNMTNETIWVKSCELAKNGKVAVRVDLLKEKTAKRNEITADDVINGLKDALGIATTKQDPSNVRGAWMDIAKVAGLLTDKKEIVGQLTLRELLDEMDEDK